MTTGFSVFSILSQMNPIYTHPVSLRSILMLCSNLLLCLPSGFSFGGSTETLNAFLSSPVCASCPTYLILLHLVILITFCEEFKV
jgi:hypothetical protein